MIKQLLEMYVKCIEKMNTAENEYASIFFKGAAEAIYNILSDCFGLTICETDTCYKIDGSIAVKRIQSTNALWESVQRMIDRAIDHLPPASNYMFATQYNDNGKYMLDVYTNRAKLTRFEKLKTATIEEMAAEIADNLIPPCSCDYCYLRDTCKNQQNEDCTDAVRKYLEEEAE